MLFSSFSISCLQIPGLMIQSDIDWSQIMYILDSWFQSHDSMAIYRFVDFVKCPLKTILFPIFSTHPKRMIPFCPSSPWVRHCRVQKLNIVDCIIYYYYYNIVMIILGQQGKQRRHYFRTDLGNVIQWVYKIIIIFPRQVYPLETPLRGHTRPPADDMWNQKDFAETRCFD